MIKVGTRKKPVKLKDGDIISLLPNLDKDMTLIKEVNFCYNPKTKHTFYETDGSTILRDLSNWASLYKTTNKFGRRHIAYVVYNEKEYTFTIIPKYIQKMIQLDTDLVKNYSDWAYKIQRNKKEGIVGRYITNVEKVRTIFNFKDFFNSDLPRATHFLHKKSFSIEEYLYKNSINNPDNYQAFIDCLKMDEFDKDLPEHYIRKV